MMANQTITCNCNTGTESHEHCAPCLQCGIRWTPNLDQICSASCLDIRARGLYLSNSAHGESARRLCETMDGADIDIASVIRVETYATKPGKIPAYCEYRVLDGANKVIWTHCVAGA